MPAVTIGIPTYNRAHLLRRSLESALSQTFRDIEILVCDNGSTDDTVAVVRSYEDPRVRLIHQGTNRGGTVNFNTALAEARGELFVLLCDDDFLEPICLEALLEPWNRSDRIALSYGQYWLHTGAQRTLKAGQGPPIEDGFSYVRGWWRAERSTILHGVIFRRDDLLSIGGFPDLGCSDAWVILKVAMQGRVTSVARPVTNYRLQNDSYSHTMSDRRLLGERRLLLQMCLTEARRVGTPERAIRELEVHASRDMAVQAASVLFRSGETASSKREIARESREIWSYLRHRLVLAIPVVVIAYLFPPRLIATVRRVIRRLRLPE